MNIVVEQLKRDLAVREKELKTHTALVNELYEDLELARNLRYGFLNRVEQIRRALLILETSHSTIH